MRSRKILSRRTIENFNPKKIYVLRSVSSNPVVRRVLLRYPEAEKIMLDAQEVPRPSDQQHESVEAAKSTLFLGTSNSFISNKGPTDYCRGLRKITLIQNGCHFSCEYCFLQGTYRARRPSIKFNVNYEDMMKQLANHIKRHGPALYNMGENQDSLAFDPVYPITPVIVPFFANSDAHLLLITKSNCVDNLLDLAHNGHTIVSWSINSDHISSKYEHNSASLYDRIEAAMAVAEAGYRVRFRFDPLIPVDGWRDHYSEMVRFVLANVLPERITMGSLRYAPVVKSISQKRFPGGGIFSDDAINDRRSTDKRYRYGVKKRLELYKFVVNEIRSIVGDQVELALCKEPKQMYRAVGIPNDDFRCHCWL
jgi:spore photoproduct lyase